MEGKGHWLHILFGWRCCILSANDRCKHPELQKPINLHYPEEAYVKGARNVGNVSGEAELLELRDAFLWCGCTATNEAARNTKSDAAHHRRASAFKNKQDRDFFFSLLHTMRGYSQPIIVPKSVNAHFPWEEFVNKLYICSSFSINLTQAGTNTLQSLPRILLGQQEPPVWSESNKADRCVFIGLSVTGPELVFPDGHSLYGGVHWMVWLIAVASGVCHSVCPLCAGGSMPFSS